MGDIKNENMLSYYNILNGKKGSFCYFPTAKQQIYGYPDILKFKSISWPLVKPSALWIELTAMIEGKSNGIKYPFFIGNKIDPKILRFNENTPITDISQFILDIHVRPDQKLFENNSRFDGVKYNPVTYEDFWKLLNKTDDEELAAKLEVQAYNNLLFKDKIARLINEQRVIDQETGKVK